MNENDFIKKKKSILDTLYKQWPGTEKLNLPSSTRTEPPEGFPVLEVSVKNPDGTNKKWLPYIKGLEIYGIENITLRRIMPNELVIDCDDVNTKELIDILVKYGIEFEHWSTDPEKPWTHSHLRFIVKGLETQTPSIRKIIKENIMRQLQDSEGKIPDLCCAYPCRMVSIEWSKHHKRDEYFQLIKEFDGKILELTEAHVKEAKNIEKELGKDDILLEKTTHIKAKWVCPVIAKIIEKGRESAGVHRSCLVLGAWLNSQGKSLDEAIQFVQKWDLKNTNREPPAQLINQVRFAYEKNMTHVSCAWLKRQGFCGVKNCEHEKENILAFKKVLGLPEEFEKTADSDFKKAIEKFTDKLDMARQFNKIQPIYYDEKKIWWLWSSIENRWCMVDDIDIMNRIDDSLPNYNTIVSAEKNEIIESLKRIGRRNKPKEWPKIWVQFKNRIVDLEKDEEHAPSPKYFCTNPIPWNIGKTEETPIIDRILREWVNSDKDVIKLKELIAYCLLPDYPLHRWFALIGAGSNGKDCYMRMIETLVGDNNTVSTSLERLTTGRFEIAKLYKKLVVFIGETDPKLWKKTDLIKRATGQSKIPGEFKGKDNFDFVNYAKIIIASNSLPPTGDKTDGFYRRYMDNEFPNKFPERVDILTQIPKQEYENLARASITILKRLIIEREFSEEGTIEERARKYEERSNPMLVFLKKYKRDINGNILFSDFFDELRTHLKENDQRIMSSVEVSKLLKNEGFEVKTKTVNKLNAKYIIGITQITQITQITHNAVSALTRKINSTMGNLGNLGNFNQKAVANITNSNLKPGLYHDSEVAKSPVRNSTISQKHNSGVATKQGVRPVIMMITDLEPIILEFCKTPQPYNDVIKLAKYGSLFSQEKAKDYIKDMEESGRLWEPKPGMLQARR